ncbi:MAG: DUF2752 domain-containing protein [Chitinispirillales bacterium]|jgi:hypothetical protein|nr:DUF2752 domain-containing protein [Chitinispirillales bacterium]
MGEFKPELTPTQRKLELIKAASFGPALFLIPLLLSFAPSWTKQFYPVCILTKITGLYCPGCGTARAFERLGAFDFWGAFLYNPFLFLFVIPILLYLCAIYMTRAVSGRHIPSLLSSPKSALPVLLLVIGIFILRNIFPLSLSGSF